MISNISTNILRTYGTIKQNKNNTFFAGNKYMANDSFEKSQNNNIPDKILVKTFQNGEYEGYITFKFGENYLYAHYDIPVADNPPSYKDGALFDGKFVLNFVDSHEKVNPDCKTYIKQNGNGTETEIVGKITEEPDDGYCKIKVAGFPNPLTINIEDDCNYTEGDIIKANGLLDIDSEDEE